MAHKQKDKGDIAVAKVAADLTTKDYSIFTPAFTEHLPFDLIAYKNGKSYRIQCKYAIDGQLENRTSWTDKNGTHKKKYKGTDFDYYGMFIPQLNECVYPSITFAGRKIRYDLPRGINNNGYLFWSDFVDLTDAAPPRFEVVKFAPVTQPEECLSSKQTVAGSNPAGRTKLRDMTNTEDDCGYCWGTGYYECTNCNGYGSFREDGDDGTYQDIPCEDCDGTGGFSCCYQPNQ